MNFGKCLESSYFLPGALLEVLVITKVNTSVCGLDMYSRTYEPETYFITPFSTSVLWDVKVVNLRRS